MPELMTVEEIGQYLRFTKKTIYKLLQRGNIPAIKIGNKWRFEKKVIDEWLRKSTEATKALILVIDDDELIRSIFRETLEGEGHTVVTADTSDKGITYATQRDFDLIFLDLKMPGTDGAEVLRQIKSVQQQVPVIIITGYPDSDMMDRAMRQGPIGSMLKPFDDSDIVTVVNNFLRISATDKYR